MVCKGTYKYFQYLKDKGKQKNEQKDRQIEKQKGKGWIEE